VSLRYIQWQKQKRSQQLFFDRNSRSNISLILNPGDAIDNNYRPNKNVLADAQLLFLNTHMINFDKLQRIQSDYDGFQRITSLINTFIFFKVEYCLQYTVLLYALSEHLIIYNFYLDTCWQTQNVVHK